jgi:pyridoxal phosphate enzyme (YggS family)
VNRAVNRVADALAAVRERIAAAERRFDRAPGSVALVAVAKTKPASLIREAWEAGQRQFGENFVQEAGEKLDTLSDLSGPGGIEWHFVGALQANKSRTVAERFDWVQTVGRLRIARRLSDQRPAWLPPLNVCLQVNVSEESSKSGVRVPEVAELAAAVAELPRLRLRGLMTIPRPGTGLDDQRAALRPLVEAYDRLRADGLALDTLSMGMTDDLEAAVAEGSTMVRIGTAVFGPRGESGA